jgi:hypothetical protein
VLTLPRELPDDVLPDEVLPDEVLPDEVLPDEVLPELVVAPEVSALLVVPLSSEIVPLLELVLPPVEALTALLVLVFASAGS